MWSGSSPRISALYSHQLQQLISKMMSDKGTLTADDILKMGIVKRYRLREKTKGRKNFTLHEEQVGRPYEEYSELYREIRELGKGAMGKVVLVERISDNMQFAAKKQKNAGFYQDAVGEFKMMQQIQHENVVNIVEFFQSIPKQQCILIIDYCQSK